MEFKGANAELTTAPGRMDLFVWGERFTTYLTGGPTPGFVALSAGGLKPVTQPHPAAGVCLWIAHNTVDGVGFGPDLAADSDAGRIVSREIIARRGPLSVGFRQTCDWLAPAGETLLEEVRTVRVAQGPSEGALLDIDIAISPGTQEPVTLGQSDFGLLRLRLGASLLHSGGGQLRNSNEEFDASEIHGRPAKWCAGTGVVQGETVGIALLDHPDNLRHPPPWLCRPDGILSPAPFQWGAVPLQPGESFRFQYRIVVHRGYVEAGWIHARLQDWLRE